MSEEKEVYEEPTVTVLGEITDMTQGKYGIYQDLGYAQNGTPTYPPPGPGITS